MPELPEVRNAALALNNKVINKTIIDITIKKPKMIKELSIDAFSQKLIGQKILQVSNYGKYLLFFLTNNIVLISHLRMEGKYHTEKWSNSKHDYITFHFSDGEALYYNDSRQFGTFHIRNLNDYRETQPLNKLAPEPQNIDVNTILKQAERKIIAVKSFILDQKHILGIGNIYADEILWAVKIHPQTISKNITKNQWQEILENATRIMDEATDLGGTTIRSYSSLNGKEGQFQNFLNVHGRVDLPCPRCQTAIVKIKVNGRGTYLCIKDQKRP